MEKSENIFGVMVSGLVTDNAENIKMRRRIVNQEREIATYGCAAPQFNLLDLAPKAIISRIVDVSEFFRNGHLPSSRIEQAGIHKPPSPSEGRWS